MHLPRRADNGGDAVAAHGRHEHQQRARDQAGGHHGQGDAEHGQQGRRAGNAAGFLQTGIHLLHGPGNGDESIGIIERGQHPNQAAQRVDIQRAGGIAQAEDQAEELVHGAHVGVQQPQPRHGAHIGRHHVRQHEQGAEELFAKQVGAAHQPRQREGDQRAQHHGDGGGDERVLQRAQVHLVGVQALEDVEGKAALREEGLDDQIHHGQHLEDQHEIHNKEDNGPLEIQMPAVVFIQHQEQQRDVQRQQDAQQDRRAAVRNQQLGKKGNRAVRRHFIGGNAGLGIAGRFLQAIDMVGGQGLVLCVGADQKQLHQRGGAFAAGQLAHGGSHGLRQGRAFIQHGPKQGFPVLAALRVRPLSQLLLFGGSHLGPVQRIGNGKKLHGLLLELVARQAGKHFIGPGALIGLDGGGPVFLQKAGSLKGQGLPFRVRQPGHDRLDGLGIQAFHFAGQLLDIPVAHLLIEAGLLILPDSPEPAQNQRGAQQEQDQQRELAPGFGWIMFASLKLCLHEQHSPVC